MNPPFMPQQPFGAPPPPQNYAPMKPGVSFNDQNAPFPYKSPMGQNNIGPNSPMQPGMMPPGANPTSPMPSFPPASQMPPQRLNGPAMGQPGQFAGQVRSPNQIGSPRPMYPGQMGPPRPMGPPMGQMPPPTGDLDPKTSQQNNMGQSPSQFADQNENPMPPRPMGNMNQPPMGNPPPTNQPMGHPAEHMGPGNMPPRPQMNNVPSQQMPPTIQNPQMGSLNNLGAPPKIQASTEQFTPKPSQYQGMQPPMGQPRMTQPGMGPPMPQPGMGAMNPPMGQPPGMAPPTMGPPMGQPGMAPPPMGQPGMGQPPMGQYMPPNSMGPAQITNQMAGMQIGGQRQYPGTPMKPAINGDNSPHMPPPLSQGQFVNGAQARSPQMGYPPMPGQPMPGQPMPGQPMPGQQMPGPQMPGYMPGQQMPGQMPGQPMPNLMPGQQMQGQMPGQMPGGPYPPQPSYQQPQQARRLDPDQMPSPIQVTQDDQRTRSGIFCTNQKGSVPPLVSTTFITQDQGNASPRFIRSTMYNVPTTSDMTKQTAVPFGLVISPLARCADQEYAPPIVDFGELGPVRCVRCKAYMCPFMQFIDSGRRFQCLFCKATTEVPAEYFQHLDHTGLRVDRFERPELILGTYEFVATKDYCRNNTFPKPPAIVFVIDVSYNNMKSGLVNLLCAEMKEILRNLPIDQGHEKSKMKVGFITYNNTVHFYNIKGTLAQPQMMVVGDTQEMFMPLLDGFLCDVEDSAAVIDSLMEQIPAMFSETRDTEVVLLPAIQAGLEALKASECAGKLLIFHSTLPTAEAPGRLKNRDDRKLLGTEKERTVLQPQNQAYNQLGMDCVGAGCSVDLFVFNNSYIDIATIGQVCRLSGGEVFKYTYFQADIDGKRLISDVITDINRPVAFDTIMRVRTSTGVRPTDFFGHFYMSNTTDMEIAAIDCDKAVAVEIKHDDKLTEEEGVYIQVALLYTSCAGQRRLRVMNLSLKTCSQMADLYRSCELDTIVNFFAKQSVYRLLENNPKAVKDSLVNRCAQILACYRKNCASPSSAGQLILPECMKLLPLYVNCLLKSDALSGGSDMTLDDRSFVMQAVTIMDIPTSVVYFYPRLLPLHEIQNTENPEIPNAVRSTVEKMVDNGVYLLENGIHMLIWIGSMANPEWVQSVFGVGTATQVDTERFELPELDNNLSIAVRNLVEQIQIQRHRCMRLTLVKQRDKLEVVFRHFLVEDRGNDGTSSYVDFLCHMHKEIRQLLS